jgi:hypothetical protein
MFGRFSARHFDRFPIMERLEQGHLSPKLEVPGLTCPGRESNPGLSVGSGHSRKELFELLVNSYWEHLNMSPQHGFPQCMYYMNIHEHTTHMNCTKM